MGVPPPSGNKFTPDYVNPNTGQQGQGNRGLNQSALTPTAGSSQQQGQKGVQDRKSVRSMLLKNWRPSHTRSASEPVPPNQSHAGPSNRPSTDYSTDRPLPSALRASPVSQQEGGWDEREVQLAMMNSLDEAEMQKAKDKKLDKADQKLVSNVMHQSFIEREIALADGLSVDDLAALIEKAQAHGLSVEGLAALIENADGLSVKDLAALIEQMDQADADTRQRSDASAQIHELDGTSAQIHELDGTSVRRSVQERVYELDGTPISDRRGPPPPYTRGNWNGQNPPRD